MKSNPIHIRPAWHRALALSLAATIALAVGLQADTYTVTYDGNDNDSGEAPDPQIETVDVPLTLATNSGNLAKNGFTFVGWNTAGDGTGTNYAVGKPYTANEDLLLYAKWTPSTPQTRFYWTNNTGDNDYNNASNWSLNADGTGDGAVPWSNADEFAIFSAFSIVGTAQTVTTTGDRRAAGVLVTADVTEDITFRATGGAGRVFSVAGGGFVNNGSGNVTFGSGTAGEGLNTTFIPWRHELANYIRNNGPGQLWFRNTFNGAGGTANPQWRVIDNRGTGAGDVRWSGAIPAAAGSANAILKIVQNSATSKMIFEGTWNSNATDHSIEINTGTLQIGNGGNGGMLGSAPITNNGSLVYNRSNDITAANDIGGTGSVTQAGIGTLSLTGANTYTGDTIVSAGVLEVNGTAIPDTGKLVIDGGKVDPSGTTEIVGSLFFGTEQQAAGTWGSEDSMATHRNNTYFTGTGMIDVVPVAPSGFANWQAANRTTGGLGDDHDNDGVTNGVEWFLGGNSDTTGFTALPGVVNTDGTLSITWTKSPDYPGVYGTDFRVETSATLANPWTAATEGVGAGFVEITGNDVKFTFPAGSKDFARLVVTGP